MPRFSGTPVEADKKPRFGGQPVEDDRPWHSFVTGSGRREFDLPEFDVPLNLDKKMTLGERIDQGSRNRRAALGMLTTFDPKRELEVLRQNYPDLTFSQDRYGNWIADGSAYGGGKGYVNLPGVSVRDLTRMGFQIAAFTPAGKAGQGSAVLPGMLKTGAASVGTQAGLDLANQASGGVEGDPGLANLDLGEMALAGLGGAGGEAIGRGISRMIPQKPPGITEQVRTYFKQAAREAGKNPDDITDDVIESWLRSQRNVPPQTDPRALQQVDEFGIPYTKGQAMVPGESKIKQLSLEDTLRESAVSPRAANTLRQFQDRQQQAVGDAIELMQRDMGGTLVDNADDVGGMVRESVRGKASQLDEAVSQAYDAVGEATLAPRNVQGMLRSIKRTANQNRFVRTTETPATNSILDEVSRLDRVLNAFGDQVKPYSLLRQLEPMRRQMNAYVGTAKNATDLRQATQLKYAFDEYLDQAVDKALFSGDEAAYEALKRARGLSADYFRMFTRRDAKTRTGRTVKDYGGELLERIISHDPTDQEIANYLFGSSKFKLGGREASRYLINRLKPILGTVAGY